ncbi:MAG: apolipoprotein N-acyltransferase [Armatimonadetes bacterium]|nr:apolipoprotein N-acyltransferase [Armatimonadota bacterium]
MKKALASIRRAWPALLAAGLLSLAFPPANVALIVFIALAPWLASLRDTDGRGACKSGWIFGFVYFLFQMFWLVPFVSHWTGSYLLAAIPWVLAAAIAGLYYVLTGWLIHRCWKLSRPWVIPLVWAGSEAARSYIHELAFPWGIAAMPLWRFPAIVQHAAWGTLFLVSAWVILPNLLAAMYIWPTDKSEGSLSTVRKVWRYGGVFVGLLALSLVRYGQPQEGESFTVTVGQTGVDVAFGDPETRASDLAQSIDLILAAAVLQGADLVVLPEGTTSPSTMIPPPEFAGREPETPVLFGGNRVDADGKTYQTAIAYTGDGWAHADKTRLVIFGEYVPLRDSLPFLKAFDLPSGDITPADKLSVIEINGVIVGPMLCFEGVFPDIAEREGRMGAQLLAVMSIDDWYVGTMAHDQLWMSTVWRSIESGLPLVRAASTGVSLATDSRGNLLEVAPTGLTVPMDVELIVPAGSDAAPYRFAFVWLCWLAMAWIGLESVVRPRLGRGEK